MSPYSLAFYQDAGGRRPAQEFLEILNDKAQAKAARWLCRLRDFGPDLHRPMADVLEGAVRELRIGFGREEFRLLFFIHDKEIIVTHGFRKKTPQVPPAEIEKAERCRRDWLSRRRIDQ